ncbi:hypothetical protein FACS1894127_4240 [Clostridia bacterium]|nr:hypothetical protein FACS1894127_4240 [Clostridia bacterium]
MFRKSIINKSLSVLTAVIMVLCLIPANAFAAGAEGVNPYGYTAANGVYIISVGNGKVLEAPIGDNGQITVAGTAAVVRATSDYTSGQLPGGAAYQFVKSSTADNRATFVGLASAVKSAGVAFLCFEGAFAANKAYTFSRTIGGAANPPTSGFSATAWEAWTVKPNGDGTVSLVTVNGSSYSQIDPADSTLKSTTSGSANNRQPGDNEKFVIVPTEVPSAPTNLTSGDITPISVALKWRAPLDSGSRYVYHAGFRVYRESSSGWTELTNDDALAVTVGSDGLYTFTDNAPVAGTVNRYMVAAVSAIGDSAANPTLNVSVPSSAPPSVKTSSFYFSSVVASEDKFTEVYLGYGDDIATGFSSVRVGSTNLASGTDYSLSGNTLTFFSNSLKTLPLGNHTITLTFNNTAGTTATIALEVAELPVLANALIVSTKTGKMVGLPATAPAENTLVGTYSDPADTRAQWQIKYSTNNNGMTALRNISNNNLMTLEDNTYGDNRVRARSGNRDALTGGWECLNFVPVGDGTVKIKRVPSAIWVTVLDNGNLMTTFDESQAATFLIIPPAVPAVPANFAFESKTDVSVSLSWSNMNTFASRLTLLRSKDGGDFIPVDISSAVYDDVISLKNQFTDTGLSPGASYQYKFSAANARGEAAPGNVITVSTYAAPPPKPPETVTIESEGGKAKLSWPAVSNASAYNVYRGSSRYSANFVKINTDPVTATTFTDLSATGKWSYYKVSAVNAIAESPLSDGFSLETEIFGPETYIFSPEDNQTNVNTAISKITSRLVNGNQAQFTLERAALLFKPGDYSWLSYENGFYMHSSGLGKVPTDVKVSKIFVSSQWMGTNATQNFWRAVENLSMTATGTIMYGVSQAAPMRRLNIPNATTVQLDVENGWASGGYLADSRFTGRVGSGSQQQFYFRNNAGGTTYGINWNLLVQGCTGTISPNSQPAYLNVPETPVIYEKPFLYFDNDDYYVFVPGRRENSSGVSWSDTAIGPGVSQKLDEYYYVARSDRDTADTVNAALAAGKNIFLTPGVYRFDKALEVNRPDTVILGYGLASIVPTNGNNGITVGDVTGVRIAGIIFDAGAGTNPDTDTGGTYALLQIGSKGNTVDAAANPVVVSDVFVRVGGVDTPLPARADIGVEVNTDYTILDHFWIWRADHGQQVGWALNTSDYGMVVNGDNVTSYGMFVEHFQKYDILWTGEFGRLYFLQNEKCYDPPYQEDWVGPDGNGHGWASLRVADSVVNFEAWGLGVYDVFINTRGFVTLENGVVTPLKGNIKIHNTVQVMISTNGGMEHVINGEGAGLTSGTSGGGSQSRVREWASVPYADVEILPIAPLNYLVRMGFPPALPAKLTVKKSDLSYEDIAVVWDTVDPALYDKEGSFTVSGILAGTSIEVKANMTVKYMPGTHLSIVGGIRQNTHVRQTVPLRLDTDVFKGNLTYTSSNNAVAQVDAFGNVKAVRTGTAVITVRSTEDNGLLAAVVFNVAT